MVRCLIALCACGALFVAGCSSNGASMGAVSGKSCCSADCCADGKCCGKDCCADGCCKDGKSCCTGKDGACCGTCKGAKKPADAEMKPVSATQGASDCSKKACCSKGPAA